MRAWLLALTISAAIAQKFPLTTTKGLIAEGFKPDVVDYKGRKAIRMIDSPEAHPKRGDAMAVIDGTDFADGTIEIDVAGMPRNGAEEAARGFIGVAFRVGGDRGEIFYLRPTNARADDQLRRNHSVQYVSSPGWDWPRLRKEAPGVYESYVDMEAGAWTKMKIVVSGVKAQLYVNGSTQPCLIVNDLKQGQTRGKIGLWIGPDTEGYFSNLSIGR